MRGVGSQALTTQRPATRPRHVGLCPGLIDKDQPVRGHPVLVTPPEPALTRDVGPVLLAGVQSFF